MRLCVRCRINHKIISSLSFIDSLPSRKWLDYSCGFDKYSDMDFIIVVDPIYYDEIIAQRRVLGGFWAICSKGTCRRDGRLHGRSKSITRDTVIIQNSRWTSQFSYCNSCWWLGSNVRER